MWIKIPAKLFQNPRYAQGGLINMDCVTNVLLKSDEVHIQFQDDFETLHFENDEKASVYFEKLVEKVEAEEI